MTITFAVTVFGLALIFWVITATGSSPGRRAAGAGIFALLIALLLGSSEDHSDWRDRS
jgi:hypothetical protein